ncbi:F-box domain-containing protein [Mycena kentingensis (nom. inval.)]|nr:F-box domain-containing protein [Mycena kentingensis (nom. inval.)]
MSSTSPFAAHLGTNYTPDTDEGRQAVHAYLHGPSLRLKEIEAELAELHKNRVDPLIQERDALKNDIAAHSALVSPIRRIPFDVLSLIFRHTLPEDRYCAMSKLEGPLLLGRVCSSWRNIVYHSSPLLWSRVHIYLPSSRAYNNSVETAAPSVKKDLNRRLDAAGWWMKQSGECLISVSVYTFGGPSVIARIVEILVPHSARWEHISLRAGGSALKALSTITADKVPMLRSLVVSELRTGHEGGLNLGQLMQPQAAPAAPNANNNNNNAPQPAPAANANAAPAPNANPAPPPNPNPAPAPAQAPAGLGNAAMGGAQVMYFPLHITTGPAVAQNPAAAPNPAANVPPAAHNAPQPAQANPQQGAVAPAHANAQPGGANGQIGGGWAMQPMQLGNLQFQAFLGNLFAPLAAALPAANGPQPAQPAAGAAQQPPQPAPAAPNAQQPQPAPAQQVANNPFNNIFANWGVGPGAPAEPAAPQALWDTAQILMAPKLVGISLKSTAFNIFELPVHWEDLTALSLEKPLSAGGTCITSEDVLDLLPCCPSLLHLKVTILDPVGAENIGRRVVHDRLESFHLGWSAQNHVHFLGPAQEFFSPFRILGPQLQFPSLRELNLFGTEPGTGYDDEFFANNFVTLANTLDVVNISAWLFVQADLVNIIRMLPPSVRVLRIVPVNNGAYNSDVGFEGDSGMATLAAETAEGTLVVPNLEELELHSGIDFGERPILNFIERRRAKLRKVVVSFRHALSEDEVYRSRYHGHGHAQAAPAPPRPKAAEKRLTSEEAARMKAFKAGKLVPGLKVQVIPQQRQVHKHLSVFAGINGEDPDDSAHLYPYAGMVA